MGSIITSLIVGIFNVIGKALAGAFLAELGLVQSFINNSHVVFGGNFANLLHFNLIVIPGLALIVTLVWLVAKGLTGGNSKTSTEDIIRRVLGSLVISLALSLVVGPTESLIGALDSSLMSLVNVNSQGLQHAFAGIATISAIGGIEDSIFISIVILFLGLVIAGALILILILAHAAVFLLVYFAPYLVLFRKDGFREAVEGVVAALSMPFIITSILAVGIATMGATGATAVTGVVSLSSLVNGHLITQSVALMANATPASISAVNYFTNAISGLLILGAAVFLPKAILGMVFQAGQAMHDAFRSGHQQLAGTAMNAAKGGKGGPESKISQIGGALQNKFGGGGGGASVAAAGATQGAANSRGSLTDQALEKGGKSSIVTVPPPSAGSTSPSTTRSGDSTTPPSATAPSESEPFIGPIHPADLPGPTNSSGSEPFIGPIHPADLPGATAPSESEPLSDPATGSTPTPLSAMDGLSTPPPDPLSPSDSAEGKNNSKPIPTRIAHFTADHYKGTVKAIPSALAALPRIAVENPLHTGIEARAAWRSAKRGSIQQVRTERATKEKETAAATPAAKPVKVSVPRVDKKDE